MRKNLRHNLLHLQDSLKSKKNKRQQELFNYHYNQPGSMPGTIKIQQNATPSNIVLIDYNENQMSYQAGLTLEECVSYLDTESVSWIDIAGLGSQDVLEKLGQFFNLHPLTLEDIVNVPHRPSIEYTGDKLVIITQMVIPKEKNQGFWIEQVSIILGKNYVLTVQEEPERDCFQPVRDRIRYHQGAIHKKGASYLAYALWDAIIDGYFPVLEAYGERLEDLEEEVILSYNDHTLPKIYQIKRELLALRRAIWPQRDAINALIRDEFFLVNEDIKIYLRDCYDHTVQIMDVIETYRELLSSLMDVYLSIVSNKMNEIMKILTVISTIFIPLTFIVGIYGMNFNPDASPFNMPELNWYWGYLACWGVMIGIAATLIAFFWRRGWFENLSKVKRN